MPARLYRVAKLGECDTVDSVTTQNWWLVWYVRIQMMYPVTLYTHSIWKYFCFRKGEFLVAKFHSNLCENDVNTQSKVVCQLILYYF